MKEHVMFAKSEVLLLWLKHSEFIRCGGKVMLEPDIPKGPTAALWKLDFSCGSRWRQSILFTNEYHVEGILEG